MSNVFSFTGTVGRDAEMRYTPSGQAVLSVTVANNVGFGDKQQTLWIRVALFGKRAEGQLVNYLKKGHQVFVSGELRTNEYQASDGATKTSLELIANILDLVGKKSDGGTGNTDARRYAPPAKPAHQNQPASQHDNFDDFDDSIPF